jgi:hypothetical protein
MGPGFPGGARLLRLPGRNPSLERSVNNLLAQRRWLFCSMALVGFLLPIQLRRAAADDAAPAAQTLGDFTLLGTTATGKTLFIKLPNAQTLEMAITQTADEVGKICDGNPSLGGAFADQAKDKGGAILTAKMKGADIHGWIFAGVGPGGGSAVVIVAPADVSKADLAILFAYMPAPINMVTHQFPDNSGSVDLPDGWTTPSTSASFGIGVLGPAGQALVFGSTQMINTPDCNLVKMSQQTYQMEMFNFNNQERQYQNALQMHQQYPNTIMPIPPKEPTAPNSDPNIQYPAVMFCQECVGADDVLKYYYPVSEEKQKIKGGIFTTLDKIIEVVPGDPNPFIAGSKSGVAYIAVTDHNGDQATAYRVINRIATAPVTPGQCWQLSMSIMRAPDATFDRDLPVMNAIMNSIKLNMDVVNGQIAANGAAVRKMGQDSFQQLLSQGRAFRQQQDDQFNDFESRIAAQQQAVHDSTSDFIEYVKGTRDVYDTSTGQMGSVDLFNVHGIVSGMNTAANDPNRFVEIPLRYER